ncbi:hypothetical protein [Pectinatus brassicae]|uniref:Uncharacterized protein n=1 Tax=Pectinatus brassicae TaxID=862415 RepID=A0A840US71_9FIRM|nr:hypothetical protein [Pectinatus brassicae]MBB5335823.1 hypothetical protein [Pectinatus brassicae]
MNNDYILNLLASQVKHEREKGIRLFAEYGASIMPVLNDNFYSDNTRLTSSIINIVSKLGDNKIIELFHWFNTYYIKYYNMFEKAHLGILNDTSNHITNSLIKYVVNDRNLDQIIKYISEISINARNIRKDALYKFTEEYTSILNERDITLRFNYSYISKNILGSYNYPLQDFTRIIRSYILKNKNRENIYKPLTDEEIELIIDFPIEDKMLFNYKAVLALFKKVETLTYHSYWCYLLKKASEKGCITDRSRVSKVLCFTNESEVTLKTPEMLINRYKRCDNVLEKVDVLCEIIYMINAGEIIPDFNYYREYKNIFNEYIICLNEASDENLITEFHEKITLLSRRLFPFSVNLIFAYITFLEKEERANFLKKLKFILDGFFINNDLWQQELINLMEFIVFKSTYNKIYFNDVVNLKYCLDYNRGEINREHLLEYIGNDDWMGKLPTEKFTRNLTRPLCGLFLLLSYGDIRAIPILKKLIYYLLKTNELIIDLVDFNNLNFYLESFCKSQLELNKIVGKKRDLFFYLGNKWEVICKQIAREKYGKIHYHAVLPNGSIPDICIDKDVSNKIKYSHIIIECKKSFYFTMWGNNYNINENETTEKYKPFCDELHYWLLDKKAENINNVHPNIKYYYAEEFVKDVSLSKNIRQDILNILNESQESQKIEKNLYNKITLGMYNVILDGLDMLKMLVVK